jgi:hypothetical protein
MPKRPKPERILFLSPGLERKPKMLCVKELVSLIFPVLHLNLTGDSANAETGSLESEESANAA